jgi:hypothetical protein
LVEKLFLILLINHLICRGHLLDITNIVKSVTSWFLLKALLDVDLCTPEPEILKQC